MFRQKDREKCDKNICPDRNAADITFKCAAAEAILERKRKWELEDIKVNKKLTKTFPMKNYEDKEILQSLNDLSIVPMVNAFHKVYMGHDTRIYTSPPDPFHVFCAGLMKSAVLWIVTIICSIDDLDDSRGKNAVALVDQRLRDYPHTPLLPHLVNTIFRTGLTKIATNKSKDERKQATGSGSGYRSSYWVCALIQLCFCIGYHGDVLLYSANS
jgi:hypothetical protein